MIFETLIFLPTIERAMALWSSLLFWLSLPFISFVSGVVFSAVLLIIASFLLDIDYSDNLPVIETIYLIFLMVGVVIWGIIQGISWNSIIIGVACLLTGYGLALNNST